MRRDFGYLAIGAFLGLVKAGSVPEGKVKTSTSQLLETYDFIIAGGGNAGLTVADRLTARFPQLTVLVVEIGDFKFAPSFFEPPGADPVIDGWTMPSVPMAGIGGRTSSVTVGKAVGGSTTINGQFLDRGSAHDYDAWRILGGSEFDQYVDKWDWQGLLPYFKKSVTFDPPSAEAEALYNITYDIDAAWGGTTPVHAMMPKFQWATQKHSTAAWAELGVKPTKECSGGSKIGTCWVPTTQHPTTAERSHAGVGHFQDVIDSRPNYHLLVLHRVNRVIFPTGPGGKPLLDKVPSVEIVAEGGAGVTKVIKAKREVILSAGAVNTPLILQRSGIGASATLKKAGITPVLDLPGVGQNFADHPYIFYGANPATLPSPNPNNLTNNATYLAEAVALYQQRPALGPYTLAQGNSGAWVPLKTITENYMTIVNAIKAQVADGSYVNYLPAGTDKTILAGYKDMLLLNAKMLASSEVAALESPSLAFSALAVLMRPLSRGSININPANLSGNPLVDFGTLSNPADIEQMLNFVPFFRKYYATKAITDSFGPVAEFAPGATVDTREELLNHLKTSVTAGFAHPCCTASMLPKSKGGVVAPDMKVHGTGRLSVVDLSVIPILPGSHTMSTAYALAEKAADIIIRRYGKCLL